MSRRTPTVAASLSLSLSQIEKLLTFVSKNGQLGMLAIIEIDSLKVKFVIFYEIYDCLWAIYDVCCVLGRILPLSLSLSRNKTPSARTQKIHNLWFCSIYLKNLLSARYAGGTDSERTRPLLLI